MELYTAYKLLVWEMYHILYGEYDTIHNRDGSYTHGI